MYRWITGIALAFLLLVVQPLQNYWYWTQLPAEVATHFDAAGNPDNWSSRTAAVLMMLALQWGLPAFMLGLVAFIDKLPTSAINLPNREYWLAEPRRQETLAYVFDSFLLLTIFLSLFLSAINHLTFMANKNGQALDMKWFLGCMAVFMIGMLVFVVRLLTHFQIPKDADTSVAK